MKCISSLVIVLLYHNITYLGPGPKYDVLYYFIVLNSAVHITLSLLQDNLPTISVFYFCLYFLSPQTKTKWLTDICISFAFWNEFYLYCSALRYSICHLIHAVCLRLFICYWHLFISRRFLSTYFVRILFCRCAGKIVITKQVMRTEFHTIKVIYLYENSLLFLSSST